MVEVAVRHLKPDVGAAASAFARALAQGELSRELDAMGVPEHDPSKLAARWAEAVRDRHPYHLQLDAVLHLLWAHQQRIADAEDILRVGGSAARREDIARRVDEAYALDITQQVRDDLIKWSRGR